MGAHLGSRHRNQIRIILIICIRDILTYFNVLVSLCKICISSLLIIVVYCLLYDEKNRKT